MRIYFQNGSIPTRAAKRLKEQHRLKESEARRVTSIVLGYRNWADLENLLNKEAASPLDEDCDRDTFQQRRQYQVGQLLKSGLDLKGLSPDDVIARWQPTAARPHTPVSPGTDQGTFNEVEFARTLLALHKNRTEAAQPHASVLLEGIRRTSDSRRLRLAGALAQNLLDGTRGREPAFARQMLELLAERGDAVSIFNLSTSLGMGDGGPKDGKRATDLIENLANSPTTPNEVRAMALSRLGGFYSKGQNRGMDKLKALKLWEQAAETGNAEAAFNAGLYHDEGIGVTKNLERAVHFYRVAADLGYVNASTNLGLLLWDRRDLCTSPGEPEMRLTFSAKRGDANAIGALESYNRELDNTLRDLDAGLIPNDVILRAQAAMLATVAGKPAREIYKDRADAPKTSPTRKRTTKRK